MGDANNGPRRLHLSIVDQTMYRSYVRIILIFPFTDANKTESAIQAVKTGFQATLAHWPYLAGTIGLADEATGKLSVAYADHVPDVDESRVFSTRNLGQEDFPWSYAQLQAEGMPQSKIRVENWVPRILHNHPEIESPVAEGRLRMTYPLPVLALQACFIDGGLILSFYFHHSVMDGGGFSTFATKLAKNIQSRSISVAPDPGNPSPSTARHNIDRISQAPQPAIPRFGSLFTPFDSLVLLPTWLSSRPTTPDCVPRLFTFSRANLVKLREELQRLDPKSEKITVFQTLAALIWTHITRARRPRLVPETSTHCAVAVNLRPRVDPPIDRNFIGNASTTYPSRLLVSHFLKEEVITPKTLAPAALAIRTKLAEVNSDYVRSLIARLSTVQSVDDLFNFNCLQDVFITSWASFDFGGLVKDWDIPGTVMEDREERVVVRKPFSKQDRSVLIYPRKMGEEAPYEVLIQLRKDDMERLLIEPGGLVGRAVSVVE